MTPEERQLREAEAELAEIDAQWPDRESASARDWAEAVHRRQAAARSVERARRALRHQPHRQPKLDQKGAQSECD